MKESKLKNWRACLTAVASQISIGKQAKKLFELFEPEYSSGISSVKYRERIIVLVVMTHTFNVFRFERSSRHAHKSLVRHIRFRCSYSSLLGVIWIEGDNYSSIWFGSGFRTNCCSFARYIDPSDWRRSSYNLNNMRNSFYVLLHGARADGMCYWIVNYPIIFLVILRISVMI